MKERKSATWEKIDLILNAMIALCNIFFVLINLYYGYYENSTRDFEARKGWIFICIIGASIVLYFIAEIVLAHDIKDKRKALERVVKGLFVVDFTYLLLGKCFCWSGYCQCENFIEYAYIPIVFWFINILYFLW